MSRHDRSRNLKFSQSFTESDAPVPKSHRRSRSPTHHHRSSHKRARFDPPRSTSLPQGAPHISKHDFETYRPMFALYLEVQKQLVVNEITEHELRGRWKRFMGKWNRGELAEGWYQPQMFAKAEAFVAGSPPTGKSAPDHPYDKTHDSVQTESSDDDLPGPTLADVPNLDAYPNKRSGPSIPNLQDLELRQEAAHESALESREKLREIRRLDRKEQKERLEDIAPRAEAGSKDRILEKRREKADSNRAFAAGKTEAGGVEDVPETDMLGGDDGGIEGYRKQKMEMERKKNEREVRREEILRTRQADREQRIQEYKQKEERTMSGLIALAKARFG